MDSKNTKYLIFAVILLILSAIGVFVIFQLNNSPLSLFLSTNTNTIPTSVPTVIPTKIPTITTTPVATISSKIYTSSAVKTKITPTPTATPTSKITPTPTPKIIPTATPTPVAKVTSVLTPTPTPAAISNLLPFQSNSDGFSIQYKSTRKLYQDTESTGNRYTFYLTTGNFAVHVSPSGTWSWTNPDRNFSSAFIVSGQNTYRYDISTQTIVDLQSSSKNYTIQCVHNGNATLKAECEDFIKSFTLL